MRKILIILSIFAVYTANLTGQKSIIDLSGKWKFALDASDRGMQEKWNIAELPLLKQKPTELKKDGSKASK